MNKALPIAILAITLAGCASDRAFREGERLLAEGRTESGLRQLEQAMRESPNKAQYRTAYFQARDAYLTRLIVEADTHLLAGRDTEADAAYRKVLEFHAESPRAHAGLAAIENQRRNKRLLEEANRAIAKGETEIARARLRAVLARDPENAEALRLTRQADEKSGKTHGAEFPKLAEAYRRPVSLQFRDAPIRTIFDALSRQSGLNFVFDKDVRTDVRLTIFVTQTPIVDSLDMLLKTGQLGKKVLNENTLLIYPALPAKIKEYQDLVVKGFFLSNADVKQAVNLVRTMTKTRDLHIDERLNLLVVRDTPEAVRLVEKLVALADRPEAEVMLEVEILEVKRSRLQELGVQYPNQFTLLNTITTETATSSTVGAPVVTTSTTLSPLPMTVDRLRHITGADIAMNNVLVNLRKDSGDVNILANPRIRVKNKEKAKIHIGEKLPVFTTTSTANVGVSASVNYLDVGLKLDVEPNVSLDDEVSIKVGLEVSSIVKEVSGPSSSLAYQVGTRSASTVLRLKNGETQVLAGLISDEERKSTSHIPGFGEVPVIGRLFGSQRDTSSKTEIMLLITPRIMRNVTRPEFGQPALASGTEAAVGAQPLAVRTPGPKSLAMSSKGGGTAGREPVVAEPAAREAEQPPAAPAAAEGMQIQGPAEASGGSDIALSLLIPGLTGGAQVDVGFDPALIEAVLPAASGSGRLTAHVDPAGGTLRLRVLAGAKGETRITVLGAVTDAGEAIPGVAASHAVKLVSP